MLFTYCKHLFVKLIVTKFFTKSKLTCLWSTKDVQMFRRQIGTACCWSNRIKYLHSYYYQINILKSKIPIWILCQFWRAFPIHSIFLLLLIHLAPSLVEKPQQIPFLEIQYNGLRKSAQRRFQTSQNSLNISILYTSFKK